MQLTLCNCDTPDASTSRCCVSGPLLGPSTQCDSASTAQWVCQKGSGPTRLAPGGLSVTIANLKRIMMYVPYSTRVTLASINSAPDLGALTPGRATEVGSSDDLASSNPSGREGGDVLNTEVAHVSINLTSTTSSSRTGHSLQTPQVCSSHTRTSINNKDLRKSCQKILLNVLTLHTSGHSTYGQYDLRTNSVNLPIFLPAVDWK